jgi:hypothetical protein
LNKFKTQKSWKTQNSIHHFKPYSCILLLNGFIPRPNEVLTAKVAYLMNEGYTEKSSNENCKGRIKTLPVDEDYISLMED